MRKFLLLASVIYIVFLAVGCGSTSPETTADLVLTNAQVYTVNKNQPNAEAVAVKDGKIIFVGSNADIKKYTGNHRL